MQGRQWLEECVCLAAAPAIAGVVWLGQMVAAVLLVVANRAGSEISRGGLRIRATELICWLSGIFPNMTGAPVPLCM